MDDSRKRRGSEEQSGRERRRHKRGKGAADRRALVTKAITAAVVVAAAVTSALVLIVNSKRRLPIHEPRRLEWKEHVHDLLERKCFKRYYRMPLETFEKLVELLRPALAKNAHMGGLRCKKYDVVDVNIRVAIAIRMLAEANYMDLMVIFGVSQSFVFDTMWDVIDAINANPEVGPFYFPQTEEECARAARRWELKSDNGVFSHLVAAVDGLFIKCNAPTAKDTPNVTSYYSGSKGGYGINVQAMCDERYRFCNMSTIAPGSTNDWVAWTRSGLATAVRNLPPGYYVVGDAAYPISNQLLTPYPGTNLSQERDSYNFHLSQCRVKIEQSFGLFVATWGILWRRLKVSFAGRPDLITALFHLHNFLRDEGVTEVKEADEDEETGKGHPPLTEGRLDAEKWTTPAPSRSGESSSRAALVMVLRDNRQWRPPSNVDRNS